MDQGAAQTQTHTDMILPQVGGMGTRRRSASGAVLRTISGYEPQWPQATLEEVTSATAIYQKGSGGSVQPTRKRHVVRSLEEAHPTLGAGTHVRGTLIIAVEADPICQCREVGQTSGTEEKL
ncbi:hypothetical protein NDU88_004885 [Pleurodeles waltl]|uniref:Uncharacterized protein n=1 Tax=Pleurodeles waltl TaxID=8319 RepID=A0AAV7MAH9_PLEWA|nr:hypothetical protein NDU88_004885 [Pleurodeles waltl]